MRIANSPPRRAIRLVSTLPPRSSSNPVTFSTNPILSGPVKVRTNFLCMESHPIRKGLQDDALVIIAPKRATHPRPGSPPWRPLPESGWPPTPMTILGGLCLELLSGNGLESAFLEEIGLKHETVSCHHGGAVLTNPPMETRTVPWLHSVRLPPRGHLPNGHNGEPSVLSRSLVRCVSFLPLKSGNKSNKPQASTVAGKGFAGHCNPSS